MHRPPTDGRHVLVIGGIEPLGGVVVDRLLSAGHRLAVHNVSVWSDDRQTPAEKSSPVVLDGDRTDTEDMVHAVAGAEIAMGGLDALVVLPGEAFDTVGIDSDASSWADGWSRVLAADVLAVSCAAHTAARSFLARRRPGRIILVTSGHDQAVGTSMHAAVTSSAIGALAVELGRELRPHGVGVSVVNSTGPGGLHEFAVGQVADVIEALLATPVLSGVTASVI